MQGVGFSATTETVHFVFEPTYSGRNNVLMTLQRTPVRLDISSEIINQRKFFIQILSPAYKNYFSY